MAGPPTTKPDLRRQLLARRGALGPAAVTAAGEQVIERIVSAPWFETARTIGLYAAVRGEVPLEALLQRAPDRVFAFPRVEQGRLRLSFWSLEPGCELVPGGFGIPTPPQQGSRLVSLESLDLILVPGVAFDPEGGRLGHGGGYYDATLPFTSALRVGIAHGFQVLERIPTEEHDISVHYLVTPDAVLRGVGKAAR